MLRKSDEALCAAVRDGHEAAFAAIVMRHRPGLLRHCRSLLRDGHAEDAVQQTFIRALQALRSGTEVRELEPWLHRIARNIALTELGARGRQDAELSDQWEDHRHTDELERRADLREALLAVGALPARQRTALLRSVAGDTPATIAHELGVSNVAARQLLHRARMTVRAAVHVFAPPPLVWLSRRIAVASGRVPRVAGVPAGTAPLATKIAVVVIASAGVAGPAAVIRSALAHHPAVPAPRRSLTAQRPDRHAMVRPSLLIAAQPPAPATALSSPTAAAPHSPAAVERAPSGPAPAGQGRAVSATSPDAVAIGAGATASGQPAMAGDPSGSASGPSAPIASSSAAGPTPTSSSSASSAPSDPSATADPATSPTDTSSASGDGASASSAASAAGAGSGATAAGPSATAGP